MGSLSKYLAKYESIIIPQKDRNELKHGVEFRTPFFNFLPLASNVKISFPISDIVIFF